MCTVATIADPSVDSLNDLDEKARARFLVDMAAVGDALLAVTGSFRINYSILGNADPGVHAHIFPRYRSEPPERVSGPVWWYPKEDRASVPFDLSRDLPLMEKLYARMQDSGIALAPGPAL